MQLSRAVNFLWKTNDHIFHSKKCGEQQVNYALEVCMYENVTRKFTNGGVAFVSAVISISYFSVTDFKGRMKGDVELYRVRNGSKFLLIGR